MLPATLPPILVFVDFSGHSDHALDAALALARPVRARLTLLHVVASPSDPGMGSVAERIVPHASCPVLVLPRQRS